MPVLRALAVALVVVAYLDQVLSQGGIDWHPTLGPLPAVLLATPVVAMGILRLPEQGWRALSVASCVILAGATSAWWTSPRLPALRESPATAPPRKELPLYLHLVLDEHMGIAHMPDEIPEVAAATRAARAFYARYGFLLFTQAFSRFRNSDSAIGSALSFGAPPREWRLLRNARQRRWLEGNRVFAELGARGYGIRVYQSSYMDYCRPTSGRVTHCLEYGANEIGDLQGQRVGTGHKALLLLGSYLRASPTSALGSLPATLRALPVGERLPLVTAPYDRLGPLNVLPTLRRLQEDVLASPRGTAFFAHLLLPHYPYVLDAAGEVKPDPRTWLGPETWCGFPEAPTRAERYREYAGQIEALYGLLDAWLAELERRGSLRDAVIVIHGDHGSRISAPDALADPADPRHADVVHDSYATLFAARSPRLPAGESTVPKSVGALLEDLFLAPERLTRPRPGDGYVLVRRGPAGGALSPLPYPPR